MSILDNINKPAPRMYRKFSNAYIVVMLPALTTAAQSFGFGDKMANRIMIGLVLSGAMVKFVGMIIANGEEYTKTQNTES